jgi:hypothetical protein
MSERDKDREGKIEKSKLFFPSSLTDRALVELNRRIF